MSDGLRRHIEAALAAVGWVEYPGCGAGEWLGALMTGWHAAVPFENLSRLVAADRGARAAAPGATLPPGPPRLPAGFWREQAARGSGGTCFDQAAAARRLFRGLGVPVDICFAQPPGARPDQHAVLRVTTSEGPWLVDLGFPLPVPLPLAGAGVVRVSHAWYDLELRVGGEPGEWLLFTEDSRGRRFRYRLFDRPIAAAAWRAAWRAAGHPDAPYMRRPALGRGTPAERRIFHPTGRLIRLARHCQSEEALEMTSAAALAMAFGLSESLVHDGLAALARRRAPPAAAQ